MKGSLSLHKLENYLKVVESALIAKMSAKELQRCREQHKRGRSYYPQGVQTQKRPSTSRDKVVRPTHEVGKDKVTPCLKCGKQHGGTVCYKEIRAYFNGGERGHFVRDCPRTKDSQVQKPDDGKPRLRTQGRVIPMTNKDAQASPKVVICIIRFHSQPIRALIDPGATHSFILASLVDLLGLYTSLLQFDMLVSTPIGKSFLAPKVVKNDSIVFKDKELHVDLILLQLHYVDIILGMDWLATHHALVDCFAKRVT